MPGGRWPVSVVLRPDQKSAERLEQTMAEVEVYAGPGHFRTGIADSVHFTVRALERYREAVVEDDDATQRYARATGIARDIWYATILHFAADIAHPAELIERVTQERSLELGRMVIDTAELVRFRYRDGSDGRCMRPEVLASVRTGSRMTGGAGQSMAER